MIVHSMMHTHDSSLSICWYHNLARGSFSRKGAGPKPRLFSLVKGLPYLCRSKFKQFLKGLANFISEQFLKMCAKGQPASDGSNEANFDASQPIYRVSTQKLRMHSRISTSVGPSLNIVNFKHLILLTSTTSQKIRCNV